MMNVRAIAIALILLTLMLGGLVLIRAIFGKTVFARMAAACGVICALAFLLIAASVVIPSTRSSTPFVVQSVSRQSFPMPPARAEVQSADFEYDTIGEAAPANLSESTWDDNIEATAETDVYSQGRFAVASLARKISNRIKDKVHGNAVVVVTDETRSGHAARLKNFHSLAFEEIVRQLPIEQFKVDSQPPSRTEDDPAANVIEVHLKLDAIQPMFSSLTRKRHSPIRDPQSGSCNATVILDDIQWNCTTNFVDNQWLSDFEAFQTSEQDERYTPVRTGTDLHTDLPEASDDLESRLSIVLYDTFQTYHKRRWPNRDVPNQMQFRAAMLALENNGNPHDDPVVDRFSQNLEIDDQHFHRAAALIQNSRMSSIAHELNTHHYDHFAKSTGSFTFARLLAIVGIFGVVVIGYYAADAATRGYYSPVIAGLSVVILVTVVLMM